MNINNQLREYTALMNYPALIERERERERESLALRAKNLIVAVQEQPLC
jgi:hypothetical protein